MTITIIGTGYVGLTYAAILANAGFKVYAVDTNEERLAVIKSGRSFFHEANLEPLISKGLASGNLIPTSSYAESIPSSDIIFSCVGTPDNPDGSSNLSHIYSAANEVSKYIDNGKKIYVQKSTVPVGTGKKIEQLFKDNNVQLSYVSNPEFLREGTAIFDSLWFDRIVVGSSDKSASDKIIDIYLRITEQRDDIANLAELTLPNNTTANKNGEYISTSINSAELIKVTANAFLATKITFANNIAKLADAAGADIVEVMDAVGADPRIGRAFFNAGRGYGGGCFPKDVSGLISSGTEYGVEIGILNAVTQENNSMAGYIVEKVINSSNEPFINKNITVLGLAYKAGTSDIRKSPSIKIANLLVNQPGAKVKVYDPVAMQDIKSREELNENIAIIDDLTSAISGSDIVFVATNWDEFISIPADKYAELMSGKTFVDCMNSFSPDTIRAAGLTYIGVGR